MSRKAERNRLLRKTKAELADLVLEERAAKAEPVSADILTPMAAVQLLADGLTDPSLEQKIHLASALALADALQHGPEQAKAAIAKQLAEAVAAVGVDSGEVSFVDQLAARRAAASEGARRTG